MSDQSTDRATNRPTHQTDQVERNKASAKYQMKLKCEHN